MTELTLIRHGQAISGATTEADYDRLSNLGHQQARWLGEHLQTLGGFDRVVSGTMRRQRETAVGLNLDARPHREDPRLNELDYFTLSQVLEARDGIPFPTGPMSFAAHVPQVLQLWREGHAGPDHETYDHFRDRVFGALTDAARDGPGAVLVTSTGVIATLCALALGLEAEMKARMFLRIMNTSVHRFVFDGDVLHLAQFGATPHLDVPERRAARTYY
ncbi:histidine phosphatase family protein [Defluviimonas sp. WL0002]|uniref:Histidine phosphatase family protein n=1 Tax=Albidovulum marisflavi TaxID=2984159 RepID=A0ABT2Z8Y5_9RHOB|nr:histidine phosphatase family protein [Defluviimonas sp. WL0002]MCV2867604.1 histidine phosphatase family protein [Defluviimonas sp. WL0002]